HFQRNARYAWPIDAEDPCDLFVRQLHGLLARAILDEQQPGAKPFFDRMIHIADRTLRDLSDVLIDLRSKSTRKFRIKAVRPWVHFAFDANRRACLRDLRAIRNVRTAKERQKSDGTFVSGDRYFDHPAVIERAKFGYDGRLRKINVVEPVVLH